MRCCHFYYGSFNNFHSEYLLFGNSCLRLSTDKYLLHFFFGGGGDIYFKNTFAEHTHGSDLPYANDKKNRKGPD